MRVATPAIAGQFFKDVAHLPKFAHAFSLIADVLNFSGTVPTAIIMKFKNFLVLGSHIKFAKWIYLDT